MFSNQDNLSSPIRFTSGKDNSYTPSNEKVTKRPTSDPKSRKDFKKVLQDPKEDEDEDAVVEEVEGENESLMALDEASKQTPPSLFELTSGKKAPEDTMTQIAEKNAKPTTSTSQKSLPKDSPSQLFSKLSKGDAKKDSNGGLGDNEKFTTRYATEQPDLSYVNPLMAAANSFTNPIDTKVEKGTLLSASIQEIIKQLVDKVEELKQDGRTETTITLKQPPILAGANLIVTSFESAHGEFNISFQNLTQAAKDLLDLRANQDSLRFALEQKGYAVHILTTTTFIENRPLLETSPSEQQGRERDGSGEEQGRGGQRGQSEDEG